jgi:phosphoglycerate dehydrogenase-like enzyme
MKVLLIAPLSAERVATIVAVDPRLEVQAAWDLFAPEIAAEWPDHVGRWYLPEGSADLPNTEKERERRDQLLAEAEVVLIAFPFPTRLVARAPRLRFVQQLPAGVSNLEWGDLWRSAVPIASGRGAGNSLAIAEWAVGAALALSKNFPLATRQLTEGRFERRPFHGRQLAGKTLGVVGLGGIGQEVARLGAALGLRVIGTRYSAQPVEQVDQVYAPADLPLVLAQSDVLVVAAQLTPETHHLLNQTALAVLPRGAFVVNVARGELVDEVAMKDALLSGQVGGFATDVYEGEFEHEPPLDLLNLPNVLFTPHTSAQTDAPAGAALEIFRENLRRCLAGEPLVNQVDWTRGY